MDEETFIAKVGVGFRFIVYESVRESLGLEIDDLLRITIRKDPLPIFVQLLCESGAHKPELIPHKKKIGRRGWATYTCTKCGKETPMLIRKAEGEQK